MKRVMAIGLLTAFLGACAAQGPEGSSAADPKLKAASAEFQTYLDGCTSKFGYDPENTSGLGEHKLGPGERAWRLCAYKGVNDILVPASNHPELYRRLISEDRLLTDQVEAGVITRNERKARIQQGISEIETAERDRVRREGSETSSEALESRIQLMRQNLEGFGQL
jgi:hypothetical protein